MEPHKTMWVRTCPAPRNKKVKSIVCFFIGVPLVFPLVLLFLSVYGGFAMFVASL